MCVCCACNKRKSLFYFAKIAFFVENKRTRIIYKTCMHCYKRSTTLETWSLHSFYVTCFDCLPMTKRSWILQYTINMELVLVLYSFLGHFCWFCYFFCAKCYSRLFISINCVVVFRFVAFSSRSNGVSKVWTWSKVESSKNQV